jgi:hypothetical protein
MTETVKTTQSAVTPPDTGMRPYKGEDWKVPCDQEGDAAFYDWWNSLPAGGLYSGHAIELFHEAWQASREQHGATLRRVGWLDQKGRVWLQVPPSATFDGGSLTPLLIDTRER